MLRPDGCEEQSVKNYQHSLFSLWICVALSYSVKQSIATGKKVIVLMFCFKLLFYFDHKIKGKFKEKMRNNRK